MNVVPKITMIDQSCQIAIVSCCPHRSRFGLHCLPSGNSDDAFATVLDCLLLPDAHSSGCWYTCNFNNIITYWWIIDFIYTKHYLILSPVCRFGEFYHLSERLVSKVVSCTSQARDLCSCHLCIHVPYTTNLGFWGEFKTESSEVYNVISIYILNDILWNICLPLF